jgi:hypothetical protein
MTFKSAGRDRAYDYAYGPFSSHWTILDDGDVLFWGSGYFASFLFGGEYHDILYEIQTVGVPYVYLGRQFHTARHSEKDRSGEALTTAIVSAKNAAQVTILHVTNAVKWTTTPKTFSGIRTIGTTAKNKYVFWGAEVEERLSS